MATPRLTSIQLTPTIRVAVRSAGGDRPAVVLHPVVPALAERLARAGFAVISLDGDTPDDLATVLAAVGRGELGFRATAVGILCWGTGGSAAAEAAATASGVPWLALADEADAGDAAVRWCSAHLAC